MRHPLPSLLALVLLVAPVRADALLEALAAGTPTLQLRLGYERADLKGNDSDAANSLTLRTRLGYVSGELLKTRLTLQLQNVSALLDDYAPEQPGHDVVADPEGSDVHVAHLSTSFTEKTALKIGRQEIRLQDERLLGAVDWRQHGQSFDALRLSTRELEGWAVELAYSDRVKTILSTHAELEYAGLLDVTYSGLDGHSLAGYAYLLDGVGSGRDKATYGFRAIGSFGPVEYAADYTVQTDFADSELDGGTMLNTFLAAEIPGGLRLGVGYSSISGAEGDDRAFDTLFGTAHKFNGWSDQFLATNGGRLTPGLEDLYFQAGGTWAGHTVLVRYHRFDQESGSDGYGDEIDLLWKRKVAHRLVALVKAAFYRADNSNGTPFGAKDESVFWTRFLYSF